ncbi:MAG: DsrE family protein [Arcobacteraceae bacterium]|jgi:intracellular sulfur oxidation DsrE/DsrF family protein|nr:DsrE family protein [Arcobacteraceae bacterium]
MKKVLLLMMLFIYSFGDMKFAEPLPSFENPRKWVIKLNSANIEDVNHMLSSINNVLKVYPTESIKIAVVTYAQGVRAVRNDYDPDTLTRIKSLMEYEVEFIVCRNTMETMGWKDPEFLKGVSFVQAGIAEVIERQADGWIGVTPY